MTSLQSDVQPTNGGKQFVVNSDRITFNTKQGKILGFSHGGIGFSTQKSLEKLDFIKEINADLESTSFKLVFDDSKFIDFDMIQENTKENQTVMIVGVGNTLGVLQ